MRRSVLAKAVDNQNIRQHANECSTYRYWTRFMHEKVQFTMHMSKLHTKEHCTRVLWYCLLLSEQLRLTAEEEVILCVVAVFHDSRRCDDGFDVGHGGRAACYFHECFSTLLEPVSAQLAQLIMAYHDQPDEKGLQALVSLEQGLLRGALLYNVFKDADALDRFRLGPKGLDVKYLRTEASKELVSYARIMSS